MSKVNHPIFVVGTGRCGSTLVSNLLRSHGSILSLSEFFFSIGGRQALHGGEITGFELWKILSTPRPEITHMVRNDLWIPEFLYSTSGPDDPRLQIGIPPLLLVTLPHITDQPEELYRRIEDFALSRPRARLANQFTALFDWLARALAKDVWVERSGASLTHLSELLELWPTAKLVHIYRDGRECAYSMSRHHGFRLWLTTMLNGSPTSYSKSADIPIERFGLFWSWMIVSKGRLLNKLPNHQVLELRYEDLIHEPETNLNRLAHFILPGSSPDQWIRSAAQMIQPASVEWINLPEDERARLERSCAPGLRALQYVR